MGLFLAASAFLLLLPKRCHPRKTSPPLKRDTIVSIRLPYICIIVRKTGIFELSETDLFKIKAEVTTMKFQRSIEILNGITMFHSLSSRLYFPTYAHKPIHELTVGG